LREQSKDADIVVATRPYLLSSIEAVWSGPVVYEAMDDEARLMAAILPENERGTALARHVAELEERALRRARLTFAISDDLATAIAARYPDLASEVLVVPPFCDPATFSATSMAARVARRRARFGEKPVVLFVGSSHVPNVEAARELATAAARAPDLHFIFAGNVASELDRKHVPRNVTLTGIVAAEELAALLACADVAVNPVRVTGGVNMKMLDYVAAGVPVLSTTVGVTGLAPDVVATIFVSDHDDWTAAFRAALDCSSQEREERVMRAQRALARDQGPALVDELHHRLETIAQR
jgi:glycosyltransferase involved in cell wall biosynthesis